MTLGNEALEREVLQMFLKQAGQVLDALTENASQASALAHTFKGSARAIGAFRVAECAAAVEDAAQQGGDLAAPLDMLADAVAEARGAIEMRLAKLS
jgi:HPt (histidine-containing phosphotransfer) domain-containing protein